MTPYFTTFTATHNAERSVRSQAPSTNRQHTPFTTRTLWTQDQSVHWTDQSRGGRGMLNAVTGTFVPRNFRSQEQKFHRWNFRSQEPSFPGTFVLKSEIYMELSFPNSKIIIFNKLNTLRVGIAI